MWRTPPRLSGNSALGVLVKFLTHPVIAFDVCMLNVKWLEGKKPEEESIGAPHPPK